MTASDSVSGVFDCFLTAFCVFDTASTDSANAIYSEQFSSFACRTLYALYVFIISAEFGLIIAASSPFSSANEKNAPLTISLCGSPNETFEMPSDV